MIEGLADLALDVFGGYICNSRNSDIPVGASIDCQDMVFFPGGTKTRPGIQSVFPVIAGNPTVNYARTYIDGSDMAHMLALDSLGNLWEETAGFGFLVSPLTGLQSPYAHSDTAFAREYIAFSDGLNGLDVPRAFDAARGTVDRVSQCGPGAAPTVADVSVTFTIANSATGLTVIQAATFTVTGTQDYVGKITFTGTGGQAYPLAPGDTVTVSGATPGGFNRQYIIQTMIDPNNFIVALPLGFTGLSSSGGTLQFSIVNVVPASPPIANPALFAVGLSAVIASATNASYDGTWQIRASAAAGLIVEVTGADTLASSGGGTATGAGSISAGKHQCSVIFVTRNGYFTKPAPPTFWTAAGNLAAQVSNIPLGPYDVVQRILLFTASATDTFFYLTDQQIIAGALVATSFVINDNTTTTAIVNFQDAVLDAGTNATDLFNLVEIGECAATIEYSSRMFWWGERNKIENVNNFTFDGGWSLGTGVGGSDVPLGWTSDISNGAGGSRVQGPSNVVFGDAYKITGDGVSGTRGMITQGVYRDYLGVPIISQSTPYSIRVRAIKGGGLTNQGALTIDLYSPSQTFTYGTFQANVSNMSSAQFTEFIGVMAGGTFLPPDIEIRVYAQGTLPALGFIIVDNIEIFPTNQPFSISAIRGSDAFDPDSYDGVTGLLQPGIENGQAVRAAFKLRQNLYFAKEHSLYVTSDDGVNEPSGWEIDEVSNQVGAANSHAVAIGEEWVILVSEYGAYIFGGQEPQKINQELIALLDPETVPFSWQLVNWQYEQTIWTLIDVKLKRLYMGLPYNGATSPNRIIYMDYQSLQTWQEVAEYPQLHISVFNPRSIAIDKARKYCPWKITANCGALIQRADGTKHTFLGNGAGTGKIYDLLDTQLSDDGVAINSYYTTAYFPDRLQVEVIAPRMQRSANRYFFGYLTFEVAGANGNKNTGLLVQLLNVAGNALQTLPRLAQGPGPGLTYPVQRDAEFMTDVTNERVAYRFQTQDINSWFELRKMTSWLCPALYTGVRGGN